MSRESLSIQVPKIHGEKTINLANKLGLRDKELGIQSDGQSVYIPIVRQPSKGEQKVFSNNVFLTKVDVRVFKKRTHREKTLVEVLENQLKSSLLASLPKAFDIIGDIAIIEIPSELEKHRKTIGEAFMQIHRNVRTVLAKGGAVRGTYRVRKFHVIAGESKTDTIYKEFGCQYRIDMAKAYFSPRLSQEHKRIALLVKKSETVVDLFAGVGPFSMLIAKNNEARKIYALDINPEAVDLLKKNIRLNRVQDRITPILGEARSIVEEKLLGVADRVIMNLPEKAAEFVDVACKALKPDGGVVHFYGFVRSPDSVDALKDRFTKGVERSGRKVEQFLFAKAVRETAPFESQIVLDAEII